MALKISGTENQDDIDLTGLFPGDNIMASVTHEVTQPGGDKSWVKYAATSVVQGGETAEDAYARLEKNVNDGAMRLAESSYQAVIRQVSAERGVVRR